jgi:predicted membrane protein
MSDDIDIQKKPGRGKVFAGVILLAVGAVLLLNQFEFAFFPSWLISWPMLLIAWGLYIGGKSNWKNPTWFLVVLAGFLFLLGRIIPGFQVHQIVWPVMIIAFGLWLILRKNHNWDRKAMEKKWDWRQYSGQTVAEPIVDATSSSTVPPTGAYYPGGDDYLDSTSVFGGVKKTILSKDFKGGEIVNVFGGAEIDLTQADINGRVVIDITQIFGGTKIIVPSHWQVISDLAAVFAGVDDKRLRKTGAGDNNKILVLKGVSIFAGVDIRSY